MSEAKSASDGQFPRIRITADVSDFQRKLRLARRGVGSFHKRTRRQRLRCAMRDLRAAIRPTRTVG